MKTFPFLVFTLLVCSMSVAQSYTTASFQSKPIQIDGHDGDWPENYRFSESSSKLLYNISNDKDNLYFCFKSYERSSMIKLLHHGLSIQIDANGKKKTIFEFAYPSKRRTTEQTLSYTSMQELMLRAKEDASYFSIKNAVGINDSVCSIQNTLGIKCNINFDSLGAIICEIALPIKYIQTEKQEKYWNMIIELRAPQRQANFSKMSNSQVSGRNSISNPQMNQNSLGQMNGQQSTLGQNNNGMMMNNTPIEPTEEDPALNNEDFSGALREVFDASLWKVKLMLSNGD